MTGADLTRQLVEATTVAEAVAPPLDPVLALQQKRHARRQRQGHVVALAFVLFAVLLQLVPAEALGAGPAGPVPPDAVAFSAATQPGG